MNRRDLLKIAAAIPFLPEFLPRGLGSFARAQTTTPAVLRSRVRPSDPGWPSASAWDGLKRDVGGLRIKLESPFAGSTADGHYGISNTPHRPARLQ